MLDQGNLPKKNDLNFLTRLACRSFEKRILDGHTYPSTEEQEGLAASIVELFPQLKCDSERPVGAPDAWLFFWRNNGMQKGNHTGLIYHRIRNAIKMLPSEMHKYRRSAKNNEISVPTEIINKAEALRTLDATKTAKKSIAAEMEACFPLFKMMLQERRSVTEIVQMFPHLRAYNGYLMHKWFMLLHPSAELHPDYKGVLSKCLLYSPNKFGQVEDEYIRGFLRMLLKMPVRGQPRKVDGNLSMTEEHLALPFIRWVLPQPGEDELKMHMQAIEKEQPHVVCFARAFQMGRLFVVANKHFSIAAPNAIHAIDLLFKTFKVFNIAVPIELAMILDFLECVLYKTMSHSSRATVNKLVASFNEAARAEDTENVVV